MKMTQNLRTCMRGVLLLFFLLSGHAASMRGETPGQLTRSGQAVSGKVTDSSGEPMPGVTILIKGTTTGTITDVNGNYTLDGVPGDGVLVFSFIGMETQEVPVEGRPRIDVTMHESVIGLDEVVAIGYGTARKKDLTGSLTSIDANSIKERPITRVDQALTGQMAGVVTRTVSGAPGEALQIRVRGSASITAGNDPLYVIDGMVVDDLNNIDPNDIESIEVLKDAASTAIYGSRGANGVVLVSTRKGKTGKTQLSFSAYYGIQKIEKKLDVLSAEEWIDMNTGYINNKWVSRDGSNTAADSYEDRAAALGIDDVTNYELANINYMLDPRWGTDQLAYIDWQDEFYRTAPIQNYELSASGGSEGLTYLLSGGYFQQEGVAINTGYKRANLKSNIDVQLTPKLKAGFSITPTFSWKYGADVDGKDQEAHKMLTMAPVAEKSAGVYTNYHENLGYHWAGSGISPVGYMESVFDQTKQLKLLSNIYLSYDFTDDLTIKLSGGAINNVSTRHRYIPTFDLVNNQAGATSSAYRDTRIYNRYTGEGVLSWTKDFEKHSLSAMAGYAAEYYQGNRQYVQHKGFSGDAIRTFTLDGSQNVSESYYSETERLLLSFFGRINYNYNDKYILSASIRRDGSSKFGWDHLWGVFPAFGAGWRLNREEFFKSVSWISNLKLRYSWGKNGNNSISDYKAFGAMDVSNYPFGGAIQSGQVPGSLTNPALSWEKTSASNIGFDFGVLKNRITFTADYYIKKTTDLLLDQPVPYVTGFTSSLQNVGSVRNKGLEMELTSHNLTGGFVWKTTANISFNKNRVLKLGDDHAPIYTGWSDKTNIIAEGESLNSFYLYNATGVLSSEDINDPAVAKTANAIVGDVKYEDFNKDGVIDEEDIHIVGKPDPDYIYGITNTFSFKNFDLSVLIQGQHGGKSYALLGRAMDRPGMGKKANALGRWRNRWRSEEEPGDGHTPRLDGTTGSLLDTRWLYDASYIKIKNITFGYNLPAQLNQRLGVNRLRLYVSLENVWRKDDYYGGYNPESANTDGTDYGAYPAAKAFTFGVNLNF